METNNEKRILNIELTNDVKKVSITATNANDQVVMKQELSDDDLDQATGGDRGRGAGKLCVLATLCTLNY